MNRKATPFLLAVVVVLGILVYWIEAPARRSEPAETRRAAGAVILTIPEETMTLVRIKRDYWNSFALSRTATGTWQLSEPAVEAVSLSPVLELLAQLVTLPVLSTIDLPHDQADRRREYGLWTPVAEVTVAGHDSEQTIQIGASTPDGKGVYCSKVGEDRVYVTSDEAVKVLTRDLAVYRQASASSPH